MLPSINGYIPRNRFVGDPTTDRYQTESGAISSIFEHSFNDAVKFTQNLRFAHVDGIYRSVYANVFSADPFLDPVTRRTVNRYTSNQAVSNDNITVDNNLQVKGLTGALEHKVLFGVDYRGLYARSSVGGGFDPTPFDLYTPAYTSLPLPDLARLSDAKQGQTGLYAQDQMRARPMACHARCSAGLRQHELCRGGQRQVGDNRSGQPDVRNAQSASIPTWSGRSRSTRSDFSPTFGGSNCLSGPCKDQRGEIYEVGFKYTPMQGLADQRRDLRHGGEESIVRIERSGKSVRVEPDRTRSASAVRRSRSSARSRPIST